MLATFNTVILIISSFEPVFVERWLILSRSLLSLPVFHESVSYCVKPITLFI